MHRSLGFWGPAIFFIGSSLRLLLLQPENVDLNVSHFVEARSLRHADCGAGIHADANSRARNLEVSEEERHADPLR